MMAVTTKGLCATIALICVIAPIIIGHVMPTGTEEKTVYETQNYVNISSDLLNSSEIRYSEYISDFNNSLFMSYTPVSVVSSPTTILYNRYAPLFSPNYPNNPPSFNPTAAMTLKNPLTLQDYAISANTPRHFDYAPGVTGTFTFRYSSVQYVASDIWWMPDRSLFMAIGDFGSLILHSNFPTTVTPSGPYVARVLVNDYAVEDSEYVDPTEGAYLSYYESFFEEYVTPIFSNGYKNARVGFNIENLQNTGRTHTLTLFDDDSSTTLNLSWGAAGWTLSNGTDTVTIGNFKQIYLDIDARADEVRVSTLTRAGLTDNPYPRIIKTHTLSLAAALDDISVIQFSAAGDMLTRAAVYSADIPDGMQGYIMDKSVNLASYYPGDSLTVNLNGFAFYGDSVTLPGIGTQELDQGAITFDDLSGSERTVSLRDSVIGAIYDPESGNYTVNLNGYVIAENVAAADLNLTFNGRWLFSIYLSPITSKIVEEYVFDFTTLNISMTEFAFIGLVTSVLAFVACAMIGRRSGTKVLSMLLIAGLAAMIYTAMLL